MKPIKPLSKRHRFRRWLHRVFGRVPRQSEIFAKGIGQHLDEMHELKADIDFLGSANKKAPEYYIRAKIIGELPSGQVRVSLLASGADDLNLYTERKHLIKEGDLFVSIPVRRNCPTCGRVDVIYGSLCDQKSMSMEFVDLKKEAPPE